ncbi:hypothetical protein EYF80_016994 [Liparis tanakae]|uniref:Uncharacterized protein n=1 Tax=Liparis tanakae TaxID=230148 RepID=A0A4Z2I4G5_9TELE|nr:hypothetical protein EYF80_016994 [Liparis tanakae]
MTRRVSLRLPVGPLACCLTQPRLLVLCVPLRVESSRDVLLVWPRCLQFAVVPLSFVRTFREHLRCSLFNSADELQKVHESVFWFKNVLHWDMAGFLLCYHIPLVKS